MERAVGNTSAHAERKVVRLRGVVDGTKHDSETEGREGVNDDGDYLNFARFTISHQTPPSHHTHHRNNSHNSTVSTHHHHHVNRFFFYLASPTTGTSTFSSLFSYSSSSSTKTPHAPSNNKQLGIKAVDGTAKSNNEELKSFCAQWMML